MTGALLAAAAVLGAAVGLLVDRAAARFPWPRPATVGGVLGGGVPGGSGGAAPAGVLPVATAALFALVALRFGAGAELAAWLWFAAAGVLLGVIDLRERLLPDRVLLPALAVSGVLLAVAAAVSGTWPDLGRAVLGSVVLFAALLALALAAPGRLGMGDVKLGALLGLHLGWLGWPALLLGVLAGFVVQAAVSLVLLAGRRVGLRSELPFGPALLLGALLTAAWAAGPL
ncbi:leader peptidase (prepilin peptidase) / N-methyltransferase [Geodermatophilus dictyosporus]|uniref:Leader peptidase (Prepilin peptidase) / N-methyltransferase n=1 Tax=Geodermatophilus dictyosporus TaxID=1523247 RepID=A0A1I5PD51_9ACTN|nr:A24 family peptidase [Geodermatophilus dictyosporus]SFP32028.1 leader peptidase (prepilin peptidase) / N-methyltransferase [Geodermatophilus dictyosporus]